MLMGVEFTNTIEGKWAMSSTLSLSFSPSFINVMHMLSFDVMKKDAI